jgi:general secretion pathway protein I
MSGANASPAGRSRQMMTRSRGFTLIEVLVAMTIMAMAFGILFSLSSRSLDGMRRARDVERRIEFARSKLAELRLVDRIDVGDNASGSMDDSTKWHIEVLPFIAPVSEGPNRSADSVVRIRLSLEWQGRSEPQEWSIDSYRFIRPPTGDRVPLEDKLRALAKR